MPGIIPGLGIPIGIPIGIPAGIPAGIPIGIPRGGIPIGRFARLPVTGALAMTRVNASSKAHLGPT